MLKKGIKPDIGDIKREIEHMVASIVDGCLEMDVKKRLSAKEAREKFEKVHEKLMSDNPGLELSFNETFKIPDVAESVLELLSKSHSSKSNDQTSNSRSDWT